MANWFYYNESGEKMGPVGGAAIKALARQGVITPETKIENEQGLSTVASKAKGLTFATDASPALPANTESEKVEEAKTEASGGVSSFQVNASINTDEAIDSLREAGSQESESIKEKVAKDKALKEFTLLARFAAAVATNDPADVTLLIKEGFDVNQKFKGSTPLHTAAGMNRAEIAKVLIAAGADTETVDEQNSDTDITPLGQAAIYGAVDAVKVLLEAGAKINPETNRSLTPLELALRKGKTEVADLLRNAGAVTEIVDDEGNKPLHHAARDNDPECIAAFLQEGTGVNARNYKLETPLHLAAKNNAAKAIAALIKAGADIEAKDKTNRTPLHRAIDPNGGATNEEVTQWFNGTSRPKPNAPDAVNELIKAGANVEAKINKGETALHRAVDAVTIEPSIVTALINAGANIEAKNDDGKTPLQLALPQALKAKPVNALSMIVLAKGSDTPYMDKPTQVLSVLLNAGADVEVKDDSGRTALQIARESDHTTIATLLINAKKEDSLSAEERWAKCSPKIENRKNLMVQIGNWETSIQNNITFNQRVTGGLGFFCALLIGAVAFDISPFLGVCAFVVTLIGFWVYFQKKTWFTAAAEYCVEEKSKLETELQKLNAEVAWYDNMTKEEQEKFHASIRAEQKRMEIKQKQAADERDRKARTCPKCGEVGLRNTTETIGTNNEFRTEIKKETVRVNVGNQTVYREQAVPVQRQTIVTTYREVTTCLHCDYRREGLTGTRRQDV